MNKGELVEAIANDASITKVATRSRSSGSGLFQPPHEGSVWEGTLKPVSPSGLRREG